MSDKLDRAAAKERCEKATPGPWEWWSGNPWHAVAPNHPLRKKDRNAPVVFETGGQNSGFFFVEGVSAQAKNDTAFIAAARTDLPLALAELEARDALIASQAAEIHRLTQDLERNSIGWCKSTQAHIQKDAEIEALKAHLDIANEAAQVYNRKAADAIVLREADRRTLTNARDSWHSAHTELEAQARSMREALEAIILRVETCFSADRPTESQSLMDAESGRRLAYSVVAKIARAALAQVSASPLPTLAELKP